MMGYPSQRLFEEVAYLAYSFHWPRDQILALDHGERNRWVTEAARLHQRWNETMEGRP